MQALAGMMRIRCLTVLLLIGLVACRHDTMGIQKQYSAARDQCQKSAEYKMGARENYEDEKLPPRDRDARLVEYFNDCMGEKNWQIAKPKEKEEAHPATHLANRGIGIGVGPSYALDCVPDANTPGASEKKGCSLKDRAAAAFKESEEMPDYAYPSGGKGSAGVETPHLRQAANAPFEVEGEVPPVTPSLAPVEGRAPAIAPSMDASPATARRPLHVATPKPVATPAARQVPAPAATGGEVSSLSGQSPAAAAPSNPAPPSPQRPVVHAAPPAATAAPVTHVSVSTPAAPAKAGAINAQDEQEIRAILEGRK